MEVANPIYDVVFKYLMQNDRVARLLIDRITGLSVQSLSVGAGDRHAPHACGGTSWSGCWRSSTRTW